MIGVLACSLIIGVFEHAIPGMLIVIPVLGVLWGLIAMKLD